MKSNPSGINAKTLVDNPLRLIELNHQQLFELPDATVRNIHEAGIPRAFATFRKRIAVLDKLAGDVGIDRVEHLDDVVPLLFPHTMYKSYPISFIEKRRYRQLGEWLDKYTVHDLASVDVSGSETLDEWLDKLEAATPIRPFCSSGTSGKISFLPRSTLEQHYQCMGLVRALEVWRDEPGADWTSPATRPPFIFPMAIKGRYSAAANFNSFFNTIYADTPEKVLVRGNAVSTDMMWLAGRLAAAQRQGKADDIDLTPALEKLREQVMAEAIAGPAEVEALWRDAVQRFRGQRVIFMTSLRVYWEFLLYCRRSGLKPEFAHDSMCFAAGGFKSYPLPTDWRDQLGEVLPFPMQDIYAMSELVGGMARMCAHGHYHMPPWIVPFVVDPDTSHPFPREGAQTGRFGAFDLWAQSFWGGHLTGDKVTLHWEGGCACGRNGPWFESPIQRYADIRGDDKITCMKAAEAYDHAVEYAVGAI